MVFSLGVYTGTPQKIQFLHSQDYLFADSILTATSGGTTSTTAETASTTTIIHNDNGWSNSIRSIFIFGSGALRLHLLRSGGTPFQRAVVISTTVAADATAKAVTNAMNDPLYVEKHFKS